MRERESVTKHDVGQLSTQHCIHWPLHDSLHSTHFAFQKITHYYLSYSFSAGFQSKLGSLAPFCESLFQWDIQKAYLAKYNAYLILTLGEFVFLAND